METKGSSIQNFLKNYKSDIVGIILCLLVYAFLLSLTWQKWGSPIIDCGRELIVGEQILQGTKIYSEIFYNYGPLSPYIMSFLFSLFGTHLDVAYIFGTVTAFLSILCIYFINRNFFSQVLSILLTITTFYLFFFNPKIHNFIFPYTYSATNGALLSFLFLLLLIYILKFNKYNLSPLLGVLCGLNIINKVEYGFTLTLLLVVFCSAGYRFYTKDNLKYIFGAIFSTIIIPLITLLALIYHSGYSGLTSFITYYNQMVASEPFKYFNYTEMFGLKSFIKTLYTIPEMLLYIFIALFVANVLVLIFYRSNFKFFLYIYSFFIWYLVGMFYQYFPDLQVRLYGIKTDIYSFSAIFCSLVCLYFIIRFIKSKQIDKNELLIMILSLFVFVISLRSYFKVEFMGYGCYHMPIFVVVIYYIILKIFDFAITKFHNLPMLKYHLYGSLIILHVLTLCNLYSVYSQKNTPIITERGTIYTFEVSAKALASLIEDIKKSTTKDDPIFIAPEEVLVYFLSDRKPISEFYDYLPLRLVNNDLENKIISKLKTRKVKLVAISNRPTFEYIYPFWGLNYDQAVYKWINENYQMVASYGDYFSIYRGSMVYGVNIYKRKSDKIHN